MIIHSSTPLARTIACIGLLSALCYAGVAAASGRFGDERTGLEFLSVSRNCFIEDFPGGSGFLNTNFRSSGDIVGQTGTFDVPGSLTESQNCIDAATSLQEVLSGLPCQTADTSPSELRSRVDSICLGRRDALIQAIATITSSSFN